MIISERDRAILSVYQSHGDEPIRKTAALATVKSHIARRTITRAIKEKALHRRVFTNLFDLGLQQHTLIISCDAKSHEQRKQVEAALLTAPYVELLLEVDSTDEYQLYVLLTVPHISELERFFRDVTLTSGIPIRVTRMHTRSGWYYFGSKSLQPDYIPTPIHITQNSDYITLSDEDLRVLEVFAASPNGVRTHMARTLAMPLMTFQYRVERLEKLGIISGVRYQLVAEALGYRRFRCFIVANMPLASHRSELFEWARAHPYVVAMMYGVGSWHYELRIEVPDQVTADRLVSDLVSTFAHFIHFSDLIPIGSLLKLAPRPDYVALKNRGAEFSLHSSPPKRAAS